MSGIPRPLEEVVQELPPKLRDEVRDFAEFLLARHSPRPGNTVVKKGSKNLLMVSPSIPHPESDTSTKT